MFLININSSHLESLNSRGIRYSLCYFKFCTFYFFIYFYKQKQNLMLFLLSFCFVLLLLLFLLLLMTSVKEKISKKKTMIRYRQYRETKYKLYN